MKNKLVNIWLSIYAFLLIFEPPILPVSQIYITGAITLLLLVGTPCRDYLDNVIRLTGSDKAFIALVIMAAYLLTVSLIDLTLIDYSTWDSTRIRAFNQLFVLTLIQALGVLYILCEARRYGMGLEDVMKISLGAALIEGLCVVVALAVPQVRNFFLRYAPAVYSNAWVYERRAYGFSATLLDTFGYGVGLLFGIALFVPSGKKSIRALCLILLALAALYNSRTGLVVIALAVGFKLLFGKSKKDILIGILILSALIVLLFGAMPMMISAGLRSPNVTIRWVASALKDFYLLYNSETSVDNVQFVSDIVPLPTNLFEIFFGSGHTVYGVEAARAGVRTDIGYTNIFWAYGIIGTAMYYSFMLYIFRSAYKRSPSYSFKALVLFFALAFFIVQIKANLLGASPGVCVTYYVIMSLIYFGNLGQEAIPSRQISIPAKSREELIVE